MSEKKYNYISFPATLFNCFGRSLWFFQLAFNGFSENKGFLLMRISSSSITIETNIPHFGHSISTFVPSSPLHKRRPHFGHIAYFIKYNLLFPLLTNESVFTQPSLYGRDNSYTTEKYSFATIYISLRFGAKALDTDLTFVANTLCFVVILYHKRQVFSNFQCSENYIEQTHIKRLPLR